MSIAVLAPSTSTLDEALNKEKDPLSFKKTDSFYEAVEGTKGDSRAEHVVPRSPLCFE